MESFSLSFLTGNPSLEQMEIEDAMRADARGDEGVTVQPAISEDIAAEMAAAFGWDEPVTEDEAELDYASQRTDEAELLQRYPGMANLTDEQLIDVVANPFGAMSPDHDETVAVAAILLERRLSETTTNRASA